MLDKSGFRVNGKILLHLYVLSDFLTKEKLLYICFNVVTKLVAGAQLIANRLQCNSTTRQVQSILDSPLYIAVTFELIVGFKTK